MKYTIYTLLTFGHGMWQQHCEVVPAGENEIYEKQTYFEKWTQHEEL